MTYTPNREGLPTRLGHLSGDSCTHVSAQNCGNQTNADPERDAIVLEIARG